MSKTFLDLIEQVYQGSTEAPPWKTFAEGLRAALRASHAAITLHHAEGGDIYIMASEPGAHIDWELAELIYRTEFMDDDPYRPSRMQPGDLVLIDPATADLQLGRFLNSLDIAQGLRACFAEPEGLRCWIDVVRSHRHPDPEFSAEELSLMRKLGAHLERALGLYSKLRQQELEKTIYESMVSHFSLGCVLLNSARQVIHANAKALSIIERSEGISITRRRFALTEPTAQREFRQAFDAIATAWQDERTVDGGEIIRMNRRDGRLLALMLYPTPLQRYYRSEQASCAVVYFLDLAEAHEILNPSQADSVCRIRDLFALTRQEAALALLLSYGHTISDAAKEMGIAESTARNYTKRIYAKLDVSNQTDLVRLILRALPFLH